MLRLSAAVFRAAVFSLAIATGCQQAPTRAVETGAPRAQDPRSWVAELLSADPVILDVRSPMDFGVGHVPGAVNVQWQDFARSEEGQRGLLPADLFGVARRLALYGISPERPVIVIGWGPMGHGEEGRVAWMLRYLGVRRVTVVPLSFFRAQIPRPGEGTPRNAPVWKPVLDEGWGISAREFRARVSASRASKQGLPGAAEPLAILDVAGRGGKGLSVKPEISTPVLTWDWRGLFREDGRMSDDLTTKMEQLGLRPEHEIIVVDAGSVAAAAVVFALRENGFGKARLLMGGTDYLDLMDRAVKR